ncbi:MAG TPA: serine/threonine-protein kinase [Kofleriaceae bacterium]|jgi:serine/threonine protein kinase/tetratricopeptide (TPR) repeat protein
MAAEDADPSAKRRAPSSHEDAFAQTITPQPSKLASGTGTRDDTRGDDATVAAPLSKSPVEAAADDAPPLHEVPASLYRTEREIARGGMGRITAAEDRRLGRPVALKELIDPAGEQTQRFEREARITARLQHPGIVPVYEAGRWETGEPFFAMKLVSGKPLDQVIDDALKLSDRLALLPRLAAACDAIAYAHSQRIIHRDLKPSNVLIGEYGETVVIDWGLAKDLDTADSPASATQTRGPRAFVERPSHREITSQSSTLTVAGAVMGTPAYMPPEQARGEPVDQRADVFALGAMLYHLLAGKPPYAARTATDVLASAALGKFVPLAQRVKKVPLELHAIVERAMAPNPIDRYPNAGELAEEVRRFLTGRLVDAHRYTALQRVGRFVKRHRAAVTISAIAIAGFVIGGSMAIGRIVAARDQAQGAERVATARQVAAEQFIDYTLTHVKTQLATIGRLDLLAGLGTEVKQYYDKLTKIPGGMQPGDELRMVEAMELIGQAEHNSGKPDAALATWHDARAKIARIVERDPGAHTFPMRRMLAQLDSDAGEIYQERDQLDQAIQQFTEAKREWDQLHDERPRERELLLGAADTHDRLGDLLRRQGKIDQAFTEYSEAKTEREAARALGNGQVSEEIGALSSSHLKLGSIYQLRGESSLALDEYRTALKYREQRLASEPDNVVAQEKLLEVEVPLGDLERAVGDDAAAIATYEQALPVTAGLVRRDASNANWQRERGNLLADMGFTQIDAGHYKDALGNLGLAIELQKDLVARDPKSTRYRVDVSRSYTRAGDADLDLGQTEDALAEYKRALDIRKELLDKDQTSVPFRRSVAFSHAKLAAAYALSGDLADAIATHEQAYAIRQDLVAGAPAEGGFKNELASSEIELGRLVAAKDGKRGLELVASGLGRARDLVENDPINNEWKETLVRGLLARAAVAQVAADAATVDRSLAEAVRVVLPAHQLAPQNVQTACLLGEVEIERATTAKDPKAQASAWKAALEALQPLAADGRLPAPKLSLLARAKARR